MEKNKNITKVIKTLNIKKISESYKWDNKSTKPTFDVGLWVNALVDLIYHGYKPSELEVKYTAYMEKIKKPSHQMYTHSLLKKFLIDSRQESKKIRTEFSEKEITEWIIHYIQEVIDQNFDKAVKKAQKWMIDWKIYNSYQSKSINQNNEIKAAKTILKYFQKRKVIWQIKKLNKDFFHQYSFSKNTSDYRIDNKEQSLIGDVGEKLFFDKLSQKYGMENVEWTSQIDKFSPYDFKVSFKDSVIYYEVKSTKKNYGRFFISKNELDFANQIIKNKKEAYSFIIIKNICLLENIPHPFIIEEIKTPKFKIDLNG